MIYVISLHCWKTDITYNQGAMDYIQGSFYSTTHEFIFRLEKD